MVDFKFYVMKHDFNSNKVYMFNVFDNFLVNKCANEAVKKYVRRPGKYKHTDHHGNETFGFEALCKEIDSILKWQLWSRVQYEISVGKAFEDNINNLEKWDCYMQCAPNIETICRDIVWQYKEAKKNESSK